MPERVLVTGGAGFIGSHLCEVLCRQGREVVVLDDLSTGSRDNLSGLPVSLVSGSVTDPVAVAHAMAGARKVVHLAALPSVARSVDRPLDTHHACATGTAVLLAAAAQAGARVLYAGSSSAYGDQAVGPVHEQMREDPLSPYAAAKLAGELYCRAFARVYGLSVVVARFFSVFGPRQPANSQYSGVIAAFSRALIDGTPVRIDGDGEQVRDFTYVEDLVQGIVQCLDAEHAGLDTVNLAYGRATSVRDVYTTLCALARELLGRTTIPDPIQAPPRQGDVRHSVADTSRARTRFGFAPRIGFAEGMRRTFDWYRQRPVRSSCS